MKQSYKKSVFNACFAFMLMLVMALLCCTGCATKEDKPYIGVWWWYPAMSSDLDKYFEFALDNGVTHIYSNEIHFNEDTKYFVKKCNENNVKVYMLDGRYQYLTEEYDKSQLIKRLYKLINFNTDYYSFDGAHLDIEPHQAPDFDERREELIYKLIDLAHELKQSFPTVSFEYDIPFWFDDQITYNNVTKPAYAHMIDVADRITIMSYRDTAWEIYDVASDEIEYAKSVNKPLNVSVETGEDDIDKVTFYEEGREYMDAELKELRERLPKDFGIVIHHIRTWYYLK